MKYTKTVVDADLRARVFTDLFTVYSGDNAELENHYQKINDRQYGVILTDKNGDDLIEHCVVSTYEYYEYKVLMERIGDKVRDIIPPTEANVVYENGKVANADAMSREYIENPIIKQYVDNPSCTIILFENPPYSDSSAITFIEDGDLSKRAKTGRKGSFILEEFKKDISGLGGQQAVTREVSNLFIWSAFKYYMRQDTDSYILFSPIKYYKNVHLVEKKCLGGFAFMT